MQDAFVAGPRSAGPRTAPPTTPPHGSSPPPATGPSTGSARAPAGREARLLAGRRRTQRRRSSGELADDRLRLIFTCCHPALALEAQVALTLRTLGGLTTPEIARAFLVAEPRWPSGSCAPSARSATPASPTSCPSGHDLPERLETVLTVLYLVFNEGYPRRRATARRAARAVRRGDPSGRRAGGADARRGRGARAAGA